MRKYLSEPVVLNFVTKSPVGLPLNPSPDLLIVDDNSDEETLTKMHYFCAADYLRLPKFP